MKRNLMRNVFFLAAACVVFLSSCGSALNPANSKSPTTTATTGAITGKATFANATDNSGILVLAEPVIANQTLSVRAALSSGSMARAAGTSSVVAQATTAADGSFTLTGLAAGTYTVYAVSNDTSERAVSGTVTVSADAVSTIETLVLTATGSVSGTVNWDGSTTGNGGVLAYIAGTSYMAYTDDAGAFKISGVPAASAYQLNIVIKETSSKTKDISWKTVTVTAKQDTAVGTYNRSPGYFAESQHVKVVSDPDGVKFTVKLPPNTSIIVYNEANNTRYQPGYSGMGTYSFVYPLVTAGSTYKFRIQFNGSDYNGDDFEYSEYVKCAAGGGIGLFFDYTDDTYKQLKVAYEESGVKRLITLQNWPSAVNTLPAFVIGDRAKITDYYINLELAIGPADWSDTVWFYGKEIKISDATIWTKFFSEGADMMDWSAYGSDWKTATQINDGLAYKKFFCDAFLFVKLSGYDGYFGAARFGSGSATYNPVIVVD